MFMLDEEPNVVGRAQFAFIAPTKTPVSLKAEGPTGYKKCTGTRPKRSRCVCGEVLLCMELSATVASFRICVVLSARTETQADIAIKSGPAPLRLDVRPVHAWPRVLSTRSSTSSETPGPAGHRDGGFRRAVPTRTPEPLTPSASPYPYQPSPHRISKLRVDFQKFDVKMDSSFFGFFRDPPSP